VTGGSRSAQSVFSNPLRFQSHPIPGHFDGRGFRSHGQVGEHRGEEDSGSDE
jgi:hypothetical protein